MKSLMRLWASLLIVWYGGMLLLPAVALAATAPFPTCSISINPSVVSPGGSTTIHWASTNATGGAITNVGNVGPSGSKQINPPTVQITVYMGSFTGPGGTANCTASVQVSYGTNTGSSGTAGSDSSLNAGDPGASGGSGLVNPNPIPAVGGTGGTAGTQQSALVQCGIGAGIGNSTSCQACNLAQLVQNIINFMIGLSIPIAAGLFAWAGILYFTSGASPGNMEKAKGIFSNALIGFLIAIAAWLIVNTLLHALLDNGKVFTGGNWFTVQCDATGARPVNTSINTILNQALPSINVTQPPLGINPATYVANNFPTTVASCGTGYTLTHDETGAQTCYNSNTQDYQNPSYTVAPGGNSTVSNTQLQQQIADACSQYGLDSAQCASVNGFLGAESSGGTKCNTSATGAVGCFQVLPTTACSINPNIDGCSTCRSSLSAGCATVAQAIADPTVNTNLGVSYIAQQYNTFGSCQGAAAAYYAGPGAVQRAGGVVSNVPTPNYSGAISPLQYATRVCGN